MITKEQERLFHGIAEGYAAPLKAEIEILKASMFTKLVNKNDLSHSVTQRSELIKAFMKFEETQCYTDKGRKDIEFRLERYSKSLL